MTVKFHSPLFYIHCKCTKIRPFLISNCIKTKKLTEFKLCPGIYNEMHHFLAILMVLYAFDLINRLLFSYKTLKYKLYMIYGLYLPIVVIISNFLYCNVTVLVLVL